MLKKILIITAFLGLSACQITGGGLITALGGDGDQKGGDKKGGEAPISTDLTAKDFQEMAEEVARKMLSEPRIFENNQTYKISIGAVRNYTENERVRVSDIVDLIRESLLKDERVRIFNRGESFYVVNTDLKSYIQEGKTVGSGEKMVEYELRFELYNYESNEYLGNWKARKAYHQAGRSLF